jgi:hypothetical protein
VAPNRALAYLYPSDISDARALWVNPAGLGRGHEASLHIDLTVGDPGADARLRQLTFGFNSRGLSFAYQRDVFDGGARGDTYRVGLGAGRAGLAAGLAAALYRGNTRGTGWDFGVVYEPASKLALGAVVGNVRQPVVRGVRLVATLVPSLTLKPFGPIAAFSADGRFAVDSVLGYAISARLQSGGRVPLGLLVRLDTDHAFRRTTLLFGASVGGHELFGTAASIPGGGSRVDAANFYGVIARTAER